MNLMLYQKTLVPQEQCKHQLMVPLVLRLPQKKVMRAQILYLPSTCGILSRRGEVEKEWQFQGPSELTRPQRPLWGPSDGSFSGKAIRPGVGKEVFLQR